MTPDPIQKYTVTPTPLVEPTAQLSELLDSDARV